MMTTWVFAALLMGPAGGENKAMVLPISGSTMTCTREGDHLVCVVPLDKEAASEPQKRAVPAPKAQPYKRTPATRSLPAPEAMNQIKVAEANIALAKSLLSKAIEPEAAAFAQQLLYWANEQHRTAQALLHTEQGEVRDAADPFEGDTRSVGAEPMTVCEANLASPCNAPASASW